MQRNDESANFERRMPQKLPEEIREIGKQFWQVAAKQRTRKD